ncbi:MAG: CorA family divalent cation transporter [Actinomycetota bacterium]
MALEKEVTKLETSVFSGQRQTYSQDIYFLKREFIEFRHAIEPLIMPVQKLASETHSAVPVLLKPFFRDVLDHLQRACENASGLDSLLTSVLHADLAHIQVQQNIDVRKISAYVALAAGPTMIAGIYGMNFQHMPELNSRFGYPIVLGVMVVLTGFIFCRIQEISLVIDEESTCTWSRVVYRQPSGEKTQE